MADAPTDPGPVTDQESDDVDAEEGAGSELPLPLPGELVSYADEQAGYVAEYLSEHGVVDDPKDVLSFTLDVTVGEAVTVTSVEVRE